MKTIAQTERAIESRRFANSAYIIFFGLFIELVGLAWDLFYHYAGDVKEGLDEFFLVPAHDFFIAGFAVAWVGALLLFRALRT